MRTPFGVDSEFQTLLKDPPAKVDLVKVALEIARDFEPGLVIDDYLKKLEALVGRVRERSPRLDDGRQVIGQLNWVLFVEEGYQGNEGDYYDPRNSYLNEVMERKKGIPLTLSLIYWGIAERLGLEIGGVNAPSHFLLRAERLGVSEQPLFIDPFHEGKLLDLAACRRFLFELTGGPLEPSDVQFLPCSDRVVVARMLRNLKAIHIASDDYASLLPVQRRLAALLTEDPIEQRDLGMLYCRLERSMEAVPFLESYLSKRPSDPESETVKVFLRLIHRESALRN